MKPVFQWLDLRKNAAAKLRLDEARRDKQQLVAEIRKAHRSWLAAQAQFDFALEKDQVDYAIYALEAAEKRYEMLLKQAKKMRVTMSDGEFLREAGV